MRAVSVRELQQDVKGVLERVERGETVEVTRRRRVVARLSPAPREGKPTRWPNLERRTRQVFGKRTLSPGASKQILSDRGEW
jgi:prevent-host-death family protein